MRVKGPGAVSRFLPEVNVTLPHGSVRYVNMMSNQVRSLQGALAVVESRLGQHKASISHRLFQVRCGRLTSVPTSPSAYRRVMDVTASSVC
jgi:hypothetical protein